WGRGVLDRWLYSSHSPGRSPIACPSPAAAMVDTAMRKREGRQPAADPSEHKSGNIGGDDRHHPIPRQPFHEQVSQAWSHRLQRPYRGSQLAVEWGFARAAAAKTG